MYEFPEQHCSCIVTEGNAIGGWVAQVAAQKANSGNNLLPSKELSRADEDSAGPSPLEVVEFKIGIAHPQGMTRVEVKNTNTVEQLEALIQEAAPFLSKSKLKITTSPGGEALQHNQTLHALGIKKMDICYVSPLPKDNLAVIGKQRQTTTVPKKTATTKPKSKTKKTAKRKRRNDHEDETSEEEDGWEAGMALGDDEELTPEEKIKFGTHAGESDTLIQSRLFDSYFFFFRRVTPESNHTASFVPL